MTNEKSVSCVLSSVARNLLKNDVTWGKVVSLFCVAGGLAVDCVRQVSGDKLELACLSTECKYIYTQRQSQI